jgi:CIC family chloride channel protein
MTSVFMVLEVSGNYSIIVPVIVANTFAYVISRWLQPIPIFDVLTRQDGLELPSMEELREENILRVEDAMQSPPETIVESDDSVDRVARTFENTPASVLLVRLRPLGFSNISRDEVDAFVKEGNGTQSIGSLLASRQIPGLHPDHPLDMALRYVDRWQIVPVVNRADMRKLEGVVSQRDVLERYRDFGGE